VTLARANSTLPRPDLDQLGEARAISGIGPVDDFWADVFVVPRRTGRHKVRPQHEQDHRDPALRLGHVRNGSTSRQCKPVRCSSGGRPG
jgi:hypothetical protein